MENIFSKLASGDNPVIAVLAFCVIALTTAVIAQWRYARNESVPKWLWDEMVKEWRDSNRLMDELIHNLRK